MIRWSIAAGMLIAPVALGHWDTATTTASGLATTCHVTRTSAATVPPATIDASQRPAGQGWLWYGNAYLWAQLPPASTVRIPRHGYLKFPWWRLTPGGLSITGHPVGASRPHLVASIPSGYSDGGFQPTGLSFPAYGCWRVTGHLQGKNLSFILRVMRPIHLTIRATS